MFCPKCGTQNPETGRYCRSCGADLGNITAALSGNLPSAAPVLYSKKGKPINYETALAKTFTGIAFLAVAIVLGFTGAAGGHDWWFWMLIPAFGSLGSGIAQMLQIRQSQKYGASFIQPNVNALNQPNQPKSLPTTGANLVEVESLLKSDSKIEAIKVYREVFDVGLKDAKDAVEMIERRQTEQNKYIEQPRHSIYDTGELTMPPSVTENTTRHLKTDSEGETMTLPKNNL